MFDYSIGLLDVRVAKDIIIKNHYTHKWTSCRYPIGMFSRGDLVGIAIYGHPIGRQVVQSISPLIGNKDVLELTRLWVSDNEPRNTESFFIGKTFSWLRANTEAKILISYADPLYGHLGFIYQATNWLYQGNNTMLVKAYQHKINNEVLHPRTCVAKYGTIKTEALKIIDEKYERIEMKKKHRYLYILHKKDRKAIIKSLKHKVCPYPKNNENCDWV